MLVLFFYRKELLACEAVADITAQAPRRAWFTYFALRRVECCGRTQLAYAVVVYVIRQAV
jgi:hypothetical protein